MYEFYSITENDLITWLNPKNNPLHKIHITIRDTKEYIFIIDEYYISSKYYKKHLLNDIVTHNIVFIENINKRIIKYQDKNHIENNKK